MIVNWESESYLEENKTHLWLLNNIHSRPVLMANCVRIWGKNASMSGTIRTWPYSKGLTLMITTVLLWKIYHRMNQWFSVIVSSLTASVKELPYLSSFSIAHRVSVLFLKFKQDFLRLDFGEIELFGIKLLFDNCYFLWFPSFCCSFDIQLQSSCEIIFNTSFYKTYHINLLFYRLIRILLKGNLVPVNSIKGKPTKNQHH